jgi:hypothetical protein
VNYKAGQATTAADGTVDVSFPTHFSGSYSVSLTVVDPSGQVIVWATTETTSGFTINASIPGGLAVEGAQVDWIAISVNNP